MTVLLTLFWRLTTFRAGPENAPYSYPMLGVTVLGWLILQGAVGLLQTSASQPQLLMSQVVTLGVIFAGTAALLNFKGLQSRWCQTAMALVGVDVVLTVVSLPLMGINMAQTQPLPWVNGLYLLLVSWQLAAQGFIYRRALEIGPFLGLGIALMWLVVSYALVATLIPDIMAAGA